MQAQITQEFKQRFFSSQHITPSTIIIDLFKKFPISMERELKEVIVLNHLRLAQDYSYHFGRLSQQDAALPHHWSLEKKLEYILKTRREFYARPVLTMHPTEVLSEEALMVIHKIVTHSLDLSRQTPGGRVAQELEKNIYHGIKTLMTTSLLPSTHMTPEQEMQRQDRLYLDMMESWPTFNRENIQAFAQNHKVDINLVRNTLTQANQYSFQNVSSWSVADIDGNKKRNKQTMQKMEQGLQLTIVERYLSKLDTFLTVIPDLRSAYAYLLRCRTAIQDGIYFNIKGAEIAKKRLIHFLEKILEANQKLEFKHVKALSLFKDFVDLVGFRGDLKQFVRQSSQANAEVFENFVSVLEHHFSEIKNFHDEFGHYRNWPLTIKMQLHQFFRMDSKYFKVLKLHKPQLLKDTIRELEILDFVLEYQDQFSYILSDTENYQSLDEVIILFGFAAYMKDKLYIDGIRTPPVNLIPLCETPQDLNNLVVILDAMLSNPYLKQVIIEKGEIVYVAGPSDLGKEGGIFAHIDLIEAEKNAQKVLMKHQAHDTNLANVNLRVLYGLGTDMHRRVSHAFAQLFCTFQGSDACALAEHGRFRAYVEQVVGKCSENSLRARELAILERDNPHEYQVLKQLVQESIQGYRKFIFHPASLELFRKITIPYQLGIMTNTSSRGESKGSAPKDIVKSRAIGIVNYDVASLFMIRILMSADALVDLPTSLHSSLPILYEQTILIKEQFMKVLFAIAVCHEQRVMQKIFGEQLSFEKIENLALTFKAQYLSKGMLDAKHALAYSLYRIPKILTTVLLFFPMHIQQDAQKFLGEHAHFSLSQQALGLMTYLGAHDPIYLKLHQEITQDLAPRYQRLATCIEEYEACVGKYSEEDMRTVEENVVLALRGDRCLTAGPEVISRLSLEKNHHLELNPSSRSSMITPSKL